MQAANLSSKKIVNFEYASPQSQTGIGNLLVSQFLVVSIPYTFEKLGNAGKTKL